MSYSRPPVMVNGVPGRMASAVVDAAHRRGLEILPYCLSGEGIQETHASICGMDLKLCLPPTHRETLEKVKKEHPDTICVDYTSPKAANKNADLYASVGLSFVMGTTGGDTAAMEETVWKSDGVYAVIAPNMGKQVVAFQAAMDYLAREFPGAFKDYKLTITESHQSRKVDTSGTAKAVVASFRGMGVDFSLDEIKKIRDPSTQRNQLGISEQYLKGHAFHTYHLSSPDGSVHFEFQHNVCGRRIYAEGTVDAVLYLAERRASGAERSVFSMIDILQAGAML